MIKTQSHENLWRYNDCAVIVAHPDDETLWTGGLILMHPEVKWTVLTLCRKSDPDRSSKFCETMKILRAQGIMGDLDDGPEQEPLEIEHVQSEIASMLPANEYDLILTHSTQGEYTRHRRHEEVAEAVINLIEAEKLKSDKLWMFAYEDRNGTRLPMPILHTDRIITLPVDIWEEKYSIITRVYGFNEDSWEARTTPRKEGFWTFGSVDGIKEWLKERSAVK